MTVMPVNLVMNQWKSEMHIIYIHYLYRYASGTSVHCKFQLKSWDFMDQGLTIPGSKLLNIAVINQGNPNHIQSIFITANNTLKKLEFGVNFGGIAGILGTRD